MKQSNLRKSSRRLLMAFALALLGGTLTASAEAKTANFNNGLPTGWSLVGDLTNDDTRARSGKGIWTYSKSETGNYVITEAVESTFEFYARAYNKNSASEVIVYKYTGTGLGDKLYTTGSLKTSSTPSWSKYSFNIPNGTQLAIVLNYAAIDDVTYTPYVPSETATLVVTDFASGSSYDFGGTAVPEGTTKTFTLQNKGLAALTISSIAVTGGYTITEGAGTTTIAAEGSANVTVATPAADASGALTITSNDANSPYIINLSSTYKVPVPVMGLDMTTVAFGKVAADASQTITVSNTGDAGLTATIASSDATRFTVSPASVTVAAGETGTFTVTYNYVSTDYGVHDATITVTPNVGDAQQIAVSAKVLDPSLWSEDFSGNSLPVGWNAEANWSFADGVAKGSYKQGTKTYLTTPALTVSATTDELTFDYKATANYVSINIQMSKDGGEWTTCTPTPAIATLNNGDTGTGTITGLTAGSYKFRFQNDDYQLDNFEGFKVNENAPELVVDPTTDANFGSKIKAQPEALTYSITNAGTGTLEGTITSSDASQFTVSKSAFSLGKGESTTFDVALVFDANYGDKAATITIHPTNAGLTDVVINASATTADPNIWEEDFADGIPGTWINENNAWTTTRYAHTGEAGPANDKTSTLTTPRLQATAGQVLSFDVIDAESETYFLKAEYSTNRTDWTLIENYIEAGTKTFTCAADGYYWLRFTGNYTYVDNFYGFKEAPLEHDANITATSIPATGNQYVTYTATVTVKEMAGKSEELTAKFFIGTTQYGDDVVKTVAANGTTTFTVTFTPEEAITGDAYFTVSNANLNMESNKTAVAIAAATVWKDTEVNEVAAGDYPSLVIQYTMAAGWNTVVLPLVTSIASFGENVKAYELTSYSDGALRFSRVTSANLNAATPYLLYSPTAANVNLSYLGQTIYSAFIGAENIKVTKGDVTFQGTYAPVTDGSLAGKYGVSTDGKIAKADNTITIKGFRGYFDVAAGAPAPVIAIDGETTGVNDVRSKMADVGGEVYNLAGQRVAQPAKGLYIVNGKKVVIK